LDAVRARGAKVIMWHGWEDGAISPLNSIDYYQSVAATLRPGRGQGVGQDLAALARTRGFFRLFLAPGVLHCGFGPGPNVFDTLTALEQWREGGIAPDQLLATKFVNDDPSAGVVRTRPICAYPRVARWTGHGSSDDAANFVCADVR